MLKRRLLAATLCFAFWSAPALAQTKTKAAISGEITTNIPDNTVGAITPLGVRTIFNDQNVSYQQAPNVNPQSGTSYLVALSDYGQMVTCNNASPVAITLPQATSSFAIFNVYIRNVGAGLCTITPTTSTINGAASYAIANGQGVWIISDGTDYQIFAGIGTVAGPAVSTLYGIAYWNNTIGTVLASTAAGTNGQLLIGQTGAAATWNAFSGDGTLTAAGVFALANIPSGVTMAGSLLATNIAAPSSPASGKVSIWTDSTDLRFHDKNASGIIGTTVVADTGASNNFLTAISAAGAISKAQPAFSNISGQFTLAQFPNMAANTALANGTSGSAVPTAFAMPSCSTSSTALQWLTNTGFQCGTITASASSVTVGTTTVASGADKGILYQNGASPTGTIGQYTLTGTGTVAVMQTSPSLITPALGVASATTLNKLTITAPATGSTLTVADGKTLTASNSLTFTGTDSTSFAFPATSDTVAGLATAQTFTGVNIYNIASTVTSGAGNALDDWRIASATTTITGTTTTARLSKATFYKPTYTDASAVTVTDAATVYIEACPVAAGSVTITNCWSLMIPAGATKLGGATTIGGALTYGGVTLSNAVTGTGNMVLATSPTLTTPTIGVATATSVNKLAITAPATSATLAVPDGTTLTGCASSCTTAGLGVTNAFTGANSFSGVTTWTGSLKAPIRTVTGAGAITVSATTDYFICVNKASGAATTVNLPASPATGLQYVIKDCKGDAATNNITITPNAGNIDNAGTYVMTTNLMSVGIIYDGTAWYVN